MPRRPSERDLLSTLAAIAESDNADEELAELLKERIDDLTAVLGMSAARIRVIFNSAPIDRTVAIRLALRRCRGRRAATLRQLACARADAAAHKLISLARWHPDRVELDSRIVLGELLVDRGRKAVLLEIEDRTSVAIWRSKLKEAARALPFSDVRCFVDATGLNFRWHGGRGGLVLVTQNIEKCDSSVVLNIRLDCPRPKSKACCLHARPRTAVAARIGDVLSDLGVV